MSAISPGTRVKVCDDLIHDFGGSPGTVTERSHSGKFWCVVLDGFDYAAPEWGNPDWHLYTEHELEVLP